MRINDGLVAGAVVFLLLVGMIGVPSYFRIRHNNIKKNIVNNIPDFKKQEFAIKYDSTLLAAFDSLHSIDNSIYQKNIKKALSITYKKLVNRSVKKRDEAEYYFIDIRDDELRAAATDTMYNFAIPGETPQMEYMLGYKAWLPDTLRARLKNSRPR